MSTTYEIKLVSEVDAEWLHRQVDVVPEGMLYVVIRTSASTRRGEPVKLITAWGLHTTRLNAAAAVRRHINRDIVTR